MLLYLTVACIYLPEIRQTFRECLAHITDEEITVGCKGTTLYGQPTEICDCVGDFCNTASTPTYDWSTIVVLIIAQWAIVAV